ncbi:hypothetical protein A4X13_0g7927 [Tilletia indica]|uniref:Uncharacterized protein n=1 Tax=Tilletia indica TaxID=43049 RepID=A0A8T8SH21_9BASI|nr:hypothetical protein A4X13_0g7927 [Tilletia indica]
MKPEDKEFLFSVLSEELQQPQQDPEPQHQQHHHPQPDPEPQHQQHHHQLPQSHHPQPPQIQPAQQPQAQYAQQQYVLSYPDDPHAFNVIPSPVPAPDREVVCGEGRQ